MSLRFASFPLSSHPLTLLILFFPLDVGGGSVSNKTRYSLARIPLRWMIRECFKTNSGIMFNSESLFSIGLDPSTLYPVVTPRPDPLPIGPHDRIQGPPEIPIPINIQALLMKKTKHPDLLKDFEIPFLGTEEAEELRDAISPKYDQLKIKKFWWIIEILPFIRVSQKKQDDWVKYLLYVFIYFCLCLKVFNIFYFFPSNFGRPHFAGPRHIPHQKLNGIKVHRSVALRMKAQFEDESARRREKKYTPKAHFKVDPTWVD